MVATKGSAAGCESSRVMSCRVPPLGILSAEFLRAGKIVHYDSIGFKTIVADNIVHRIAEFGFGISGVGPFVAKHQDRERSFRSFDVAATFFPIADEAALQAFEQRTGPFGIGARGVVNDDIMFDWWT